MTALTVHKFSSSTFRLDIPNPVEVTHVPYPTVGDVIVAEALTENEASPFVELKSGEKSRVLIGDIIAGVAGSRQALRGFVGYPPFRIHEQDELALLNIGGVLGRLLDAPTDLGQPIRMRVLGVAINGDRPYNIREGCIEGQWKLASSAPIVLIVGTCMEVGKTEAAQHLIRHFAGKGLNVCGAKLSGAASLRDVRVMEKAGASRVMSFIDAGLPSTVDAVECVPPVKGVLAALNAEDPDLIVVECGDGIHGRYRVDEIISDENLMSFVAATIVCAADLGGALGARDTLNRIGLVPTFFSGPVTDTIAGSEYVEEKFGISALNARKQGAKMGDLILERVRRFEGAAK